MRKDAHHDNALAGPLDTTEKNKLDQKTAPEH